MEIDIPESIKRDIEFIPHELMSEVIGNILIKYITSTPMVVESNQKDYINSSALEEMLSRLISSSNITTEVNSKTLTEVCIEQPNVVKEVNIIEEYNSSNSYCIEDDGEEEDDLLK